jgi:hypothetical protein
MTDHCNFCDPAHEQSWFREHSANLRRLREDGSLVLGARYADKGLVVLSAVSEDEAHARCGAIHPLSMACSATSCTVSW